jgi:hypothetical protein
MPLKNTLMRIFVIFLLPFTLFTNISSAQIRKGTVGRKGSVYFSAGWNTAWYNQPTIRIEQPTLGNSYDITTAKADNKGDTKFSFSNLNYRLGYYFNYNQTCGIEISYDPVNFHLVDGQTVQFKGTINDVKNVTKPVVFSSKNGYFYSMGGSNLILLNFVRRFTLYRPTSNKIGVDAIAKLGIGPVMPSLTSTLDSNAGSDPGFQMRGWNAGAEAALRVTLMRYLYLEFAGKYDYASYSDLKVYNGTAKQTLNTTEFIASLGFTFPTVPNRRFNPLFYKPNKVITILPLFTLNKEKDDIDYSESKKSKKSKEIEAKRGKDELEEIPEFQEIIDKRDRRIKVVDTTPIDSTIYRAVLDSMNKAIADSLAGVNWDDTLSRKERKMKAKLEKKERKLKENVAVDSLGNPIVTDSTQTIPAPEVKDSSAIEAPKEAKQLSKKELKALKKKEEQAVKDSLALLNGEPPAKLTKKQLKEQQKKEEAERKAAEELKKAEEKPAETVPAVEPEKPVETAKPAEKEPTVEPEQPSKKEQKELEKKAKQEKKEQERLEKEKLKEEAKEKARLEKEAKEKEKEEGKEKARLEKEAKEKAKEENDNLEKEKQAAKDKIEQEKKEKEEKIAEEKRALKEKKEQEAKDREEAKAKREQEANDKKAAREKEMADLKAKREAEREEAKNKREKEMQEMKEKREREMQELKEKREKELQELKEKREREKEEREKEKREKEEKDKEGK